MTKKQRQLFFKKSTELILKLGAKRDGGETYPFTLQTQAGRLWLCPSEDETFGLGTVFTYFDDPAAARKLVDCNKFSGKWNFHYFDAWDTDTAIDDLTYWLEKVILSPISTTVSPSTSTVAVM